MSRYVIISALLHLLILGLCFLPMVLYGGGGGGSLGPMELVLEGGMELPGGEDPLAEDSPTEPAPENTAKPEPTPKVTPTHGKNKNKERTPEPEPTEFRSIVGQDAKTRTVSPTPTRTKKLTQTPTLTATPTDTVLDPTETRTPTPTVEEPTGTPTETPEDTATPKPTKAKPTETPKATETPKPTATPKPAKKPTVTPVPPKAAEVVKAPEPTGSPTPNPTKRGEIAKAVKELAGAITSGAKASTGKDSPALAASAVSSVGSTGGVFTAEGATGSGTGTGDDPDGAGGSGSGVGIGGPGNGGTGTGYGLITSVPFADRGYLMRLKNELTRNYHPPTLRLRGKENKNAVVKFTIQSNGEITDIEVETSSGNKGIDKAAKAAVEAIGVFEPLPDGTMDLGVKCDFVGKEPSVNGQ